MPPMAKKTPTEKIELEPDAWDRFERAVGVVAKSPPQHRSKPAKGKPTNPAKKSKPACGR